MKSRSAVPRSWSKLPRWRIRLMSGRATNLNAAMSAFKLVEGL